jgi:hypothetical protein
MIRFVIGIVLGFMLATVGLTGVARILDKGVDQIRAVAKDQVNGASLDKQVESAKDTVTKIVQWLL